MGAGPGDGPMNFATSWRLEREPVKCIARLGETFCRKVLFTARRGAAPHIVPVVAANGAILDPVRLRTAAEIIECRKCHTQYDTGAACHAAA